MRYLIALLLILSTQSSWALYKCTGAGGSVSFQEQPCERAQAQTAIKPLVEAPKMGAPSFAEGTMQSSAPGAAPSAGRPSIDEQNRQYEAERLRRDATYALRDKLAELDRHRAYCDRQQRVILANRERANNNLAGAMYEQSIATEASAAATRCDTRGRDLQAEVEEARRQCTARGCT